MTTTATKTRLGHGLLAAVCAVVAATCGSDSPGGPSPTTVRVASITPTTGSTFGGTAVTIGGEGIPTMPHTLGASQDECEGQAWRFVTVRERKKGGR